MSIIGYTYTLQVEAPHHERGASTLVAAVQRQLQRAHATFVSTPGHTWTVEVGRSGNLTEVRQILDKNGFKNLPKRTVSRAITDKHCTPERADA